MNKKEILICFIKNCIVLFMTFILSDVIVEKFEMNSDFLEMLICVALAVVLYVSVTLVIKGIKSMKQKSMRNYIIIFVTIVAVIIIAHLIAGGGLLKIVELSYFSSKVEIITDLDMYHNVIGENVDEEYMFKRGEHEKIFPSTIDDLNVTDFQMVYYNPWDPQYIAQLEVEYDEQAYQHELERLEQYGIDTYIGEYGATGFSEYDVQALDVLEQHYGMVYALRDDENQSITYVELFFCNFFYDLEYWKYIDESLLPEHFDAKKDNAYRELYLEEMRN